MKKNIVILFLATGIFSLTTLACQSEKKEHSMGGNTLSGVTVVNELDPVCKMETSEHLKDTLTYQGKLYGFCSNNCKEEFKKEPEKYLKK